MPVTYCVCMFYCSYRTQMKSQEIAPRSTLGEGMPQTSKRARAQSARGCQVMKCVSDDGSPADAERP